MALLGTAVRVYLMYAAGLLVVLGVVALLGTVLPDGIALFGGFLFVALLGLAGAGWYAVSRR